MLPEPPSLGEPGPETIALAIFLVTAGPRGVPFGPHRLNRNGGAPAAAAARAFGRPPACSPTTPSPSMKNVSDPWRIGMLRR